MSQETEKVLIHLPTQSMWYEVEEGITQQSTRGKTEQHLEQVLVLVAVWLNWDQKQDEERSCTDQQGGSDSLQTGIEKGLLFIFLLKNWLTDCKVVKKRNEGKIGIRGHKIKFRSTCLKTIKLSQWLNNKTNNDMESLFLRGLWRKTKKSYKNQRLFIDPWLC